MHAMAKKETMQRILVVIPTSTFTQRQLLEGLLAYAHEKPGASWQLHRVHRDGQADVLERRARKGLCGTPGRGRLCASNRTVDEIATSCGFCGASHLGLRVKAATGKTPRDFR